MAIKTYMLTIEYNDETDTIEYLQEEVIGEPEEQKEGDSIRAMVDLEKYFDKDILEYIRRTYIVGET